MDIARNPGAGHAHGASEVVLADASDNTVNSGVRQGTGDTTPAPLIVSAVQYESPVGKPFGYENGKVTKPEKNHRSEKAVGETYAFPSFEDFAAWRKPLPSNTILTSGTFEDMGEIPVVYKDKEQPGEVSASKKYLPLREDAPS
jgi:hypothetical protein